MAHNVRVDKLAKLAKDGHVIAGKYTYKVTCKNKNCGHLADETSNVTAQARRIGHHAEVKAQYRSKNPNDKAHVRANRNKKKAGTRGNS